MQQQTVVSSQPIQPVSALDLGRRAQFIQRTYAHLLGAIAAFVGVEVMLFKSGIAESMARAMLSTNWLFVLGAFMVVSWLASRFAFSTHSVAAQYAGLGAYVVAQAILFVPMLYIAQAQAPGVIESAATVTLVAFTALTGVVFFTRTDFSFLGALVKWGGILALVAIIASVLFGTGLGTWFSVAMIGLAGAAILYDTSNVLKRFPEDRYVGASLQLFASVALMFWYVLQLFMSRD